MYMCMSVCVCVLCVQFEESQVSRFLVSMEASEIPFRIVLNKADLVSTEELQRRTDQVHTQTHTQTHTRARRHTGYACMH